MKKTLSLVLALVIILSTCCVSLYAYAEEKEFEANKLILENLLNERTWVLETLVDSDFSNNPYVEESRTTLMEQELDNYSNNLAFKALVNVLVYYDDFSSTLVSLTVDEYQKLMEALGVDTQEEVDEILQDSCQSLPERTYESILNQVFTANYTASNGMKLSDDEDDLSSIRSLKKQLSNYKDFNSLVSATISSGTGTGASSAIKSYASYTSAYGKNLSNFESAFSDYLAEPTDGAEIRKKEIALVNYLSIKAFQSFVSPLNDDWEFKYGVQDIHAPKATNIIKRVGQVIDFTNGTLQNLILIEEIQEQKDSTLDLLTRLENNTSNEKMLSVIDNYKELTTDEAYEKTLKYKSITDFMSSSGLVYEGGAFVVKKIFGVIEKAATTNLTCSSITSIAKSIVADKKLFDIGLVLIDACTGIKDTSKKTYELIRVNEILNVALKVYKEDLANYKADPTDENAAKVLDDLNFIKRLRLRGETIAYNSVKNQLSSSFALLFFGDTENIALTYTINMDAILGATLEPNSFREYKIPSGKTAQINCTGVGKACYIFNEDGVRESECHEFGFVAMGGVTLTNSTLKIVNNTSTPFYIPCLHIIGDCTLQLKNSNDLIVGEILCDGKLTIEAEDSGSLEVNIDTNLSGSNATIDGYIDLNGELYGSGSITSLLIDDNVDKTFNGTLSVGNLKLDSTGYITFASPVTVSSSIYNTKTKTKRYSNLILTGNCSISGGEYYGGFTASNWSTSGSLVVDGDLYSKNTNTIGGNLTVNGSLDNSSNGTIAINGDLNVLGDVNYSNGNITGIGSFNAYGDANIGSVAVSCSSLNFLGKSKQNLNITDSLTVENFSNKNTSLSGLTVNGNLTVTKSLYTEENSVYKNGKNIVVTGDCTLNNKPVNGSLTAKGWVCNDDNATITDNLYLTGDITLEEGKTLNVENYYQSAGTTTIGKNAVLNINNETLLNNGCNNSGTVNVKGDFVSIGDTTSTGSLNMSADVNINTLFCCSMNFVGKSKQNLNITDSLTVENFSNKNTSLSGLTVNGNLTVTKSLYTEENSVYKNGKNIVVTGDCTLNNKPVNGSLTASGWVCSDDNATITDNLYLTGDITLEEGKTLNVENYYQSAGTTTIGKNAVLNINNETLLKNGCNNSGTINAKGDFVGNDELTGGTYNVEGTFISNGTMTSGDYTVGADFTCNSTVNVNSITLNSKQSQTYYSSSTSKVNKLILNNQSLSGVKINSVIDVYENFSNNAKKVVGLSNIHVLSNNYSGASTINGDFIVDSDFTVPAGEHVVINGNLIIKNSATLSFGEKSTITVNGSLKTTSASVNIPVDSSLVVKDNTILSSATIVVDGTLKTNKDITASSGSITGSGVLEVSGDFYASSLTTSGVNLALTSKVPQTISGSTFNFNNITCNNTSKSGVVLNSQVKYSGELKLNGSNVINSYKFVLA